MEIVYDYDCHTEEAMKGTHVKVLFKTDSKLLHDERLMDLFLRLLVNRIGMQRLRDPIIDNVAFRLKEIGVECFVDEGGITGFVTLSTSHVACHTWPAHNGKEILDLPGRAVLDVYSCREFRKEDVKDIVYNIYRPITYKCTDLSFALDPDTEYQIITYKKNKNQNEE